MKRTIDVSNWQGAIPVKVWKQNKDRIPCVMIRCSYTSWNGFNLHEDASFEENFVAAVKAGLLVGVYHYSQAISESEARREAEFALKVVQKYERKYDIHLTLPVAFDWEFGGRLSAYVARRLGKVRCANICMAFARKVKITGYSPLVYANLSTLNAYIASDIYKYVPIWVAQYHTRCDYKHPIYMWQYSSSGRVPGIKGRVDMNILYGQESSSKPERSKYYAYELPKLPKRGWFTSGDKGDEVRKLQRFLNWYGEYGLAVDGEVGRKTIEAVRYYQGREKLKVDGAFGKECLNNAKKKFKKGA